MSNKSVLENLLSEIEAYATDRRNRDRFAERFGSAIEALEGIPYSIVTEYRDWQYKIETEGFFDEDGFESEDVILQLTVWVKGLVATYS